MKEKSVEQTIAALLNKTRKKLAPAEISAITQAFIEAGTHAVLAKVGTGEDAAKALNFAREFGDDTRLQLARKTATAALPKPYQSPEWKRLSRILAEHKSELTERPGVIGIGLGHRIADGIRQNERVVTIYVEKKIASDELNNRLALPRLLRAKNGDTVPVDVVEFGKFRRTTSGGSSIGQGNTWGTLGVFGIDISSGKQVALTAQHVIGEDAPPGLELYAPWPDTGESVLVGRYVGGTMQEVDAAAIEVARPDIMSDVIPRIGRVTGSRSVTDSDRNASVWVYGARSHYQHGQIQSIGVDVPEHDLKDVIVVHINAAQGDSGAALVDIKNIVLGLLVAQGEGSNLHLFSPIDAILYRLKCRIPTL